MGDVKQNMTPTNDKTKGILAKMKLRKKSKPDVTIKSDEEIAKTYSDYIAMAYEKIGELIQSKQKDLVNEKGSEKVNGKKIKILERMEMHLEEIAELGEEYTEL